MAVCGTEFALLHNPTLTWHQGTIGACHDATVATDALVLVDNDQAILLCDGTGYAALQAQWFTAMAAVHRKAYCPSLFHLYPRMQGFVLQCLYHVFQPAVCIRTVVLTKMTSQTPLFIDVDLFHQFLLRPGVFDTEDVQLSLMQADTSEHQAVSPERLDGVYPHSSHHLLEFMVPGSDKVYQSFATHLWVETFDQLGVLGCNSPVALPAMAGAAKMAAKGDKGTGGYIDCICTQGYGLQYITAAAD
jgi:hypothetical protein